MLCGIAVRIGTRITLTTAALVALALGGYAIVSVRAHRSELEAEIEEHAREIAAPLRLTMEARLTTADGDGPRRGLFGEAWTWPAEVDGLNATLVRGSDPWRIQIIDAQSASLNPARLERFRRLVALKSAMVELTEVNGAPTFVYLEPIRIGGRVIGAIEIARDMAYLDHALAEQRLRTLVSMTLLVTMVVVVMAVTTRRGISGPIGKLIAGIDDVTKGDLSHVLLAEREDEIGALAARFNEMTQSLRAARAETRRGVEERLALETDLRNTAQLATIGQLAAEIAHEVGTPLNVVSGRARAMVKRADDPEAVHKNASIIAEQAGRITRIIERLLDVARRKVGTAERGDIDLNRLASDTIELLEYQLGSARVVTRLMLDRPLMTVTGQRDQLQQVLLNLYMNAIQAMPEGGTIEVITYPVARRRPGLEVDPERRYAVLEVADSGIGISEKDRAKIFEPFYTSKADRGGTGLGLSVAHGIVKDHDGWIEIDDRGAGPGTIFRVFLPGSGG